MSVKTLIEELREYLLGLLVHGVSNLRESDIKELEAIGNGLESAGMEGIHEQLMKFVEQAHKSIHSREESCDGMMKEYYVLCAYTFILLETE